MKRKNQKTAINKISRLCNVLETEMEKHEELYKLFVKLSLDFEHVVVNCDFQTDNNWRLEVANLYERSRIHLAKRTYYLRKLQKVQAIIRRNRLSVFIGIRKLNESSYYDNLL
jgi:hypothetical protein